MHYSTYLDYLTPYMAEAEESGWPTTGRQAFINLKCYAAQREAEMPWRAGGKR